MLYNNHKMRDNDDMLLHRSKNYTVYRILSLHNGTPVYRVYNKQQAQDIFMKCNERYPDKSFWMEKKIVDTSRSYSI